MRRSLFHLADLFCGAGGTSAGADEAIQWMGFESALTCVNHWKRAINTHALNHPHARHFCTGVDDLNPRKLFAPDELDGLWASPECTHHSNARGGRPMNDQSRATAWCVTRWAEALQPNFIWVENVPEFETWGPLDGRGRPMKSLRGATFHAWLATLRSLGYRVEHRRLCAADYGDPTTRERLFIVAVRGRRRVVWPDPTHARDTSADLFGPSGRLPWVPARSFINWSRPGQSIFSRKKPLADNTIDRIFEGLRQFGGPALQPFLIGMEHGGRCLSIDRPLNTVTTARGGAHAVVQPLIIELRGTHERQIRASAHSADEPLGVVTAGGIHHALAEAHLIPLDSDGVLPGDLASLAPFLVEYYGTGGASSIDLPLSTVTSKHRHGLVQPVFRCNGRTFQLEILFRMLDVPELAAAQGFHPDYRFTGNKKEQVAQIGNAVPRRLARALVLASLSQQSDIRPFIDGREEAALSA